MATATGNANIYSLKDIMAVKDPNGRLATIAEILQQSNTIYDDMPMLEGLTEVGDQITVRAKLGDPKWKRYNEHVKPSIALTDQVNELCGHIEDWSEIDADLAEKSGDVAGFLLRESKAKMQAMANEVVRTLIYGNATTDPKTFNGFMTRLNKLNDEYMNGQPVVINAGGSTGGQQSSILIVGWGENTVHGIYPKYSKGGLEFDNKGKVTSQTDEGYLDVYRSKFAQEVGLAVRDYRYIVRIANIDTESLKTIGGDSDTAPKLYNLFMEAVSNIPNPQLTNLTAYAPRKVWLALSQIAAQYGNRPMTQSITDAGFVTNILGVPLKMQDCMLTTESVVK